MKKFFLILCGILLTAIFAVGCNRLKQSSSVANVSSLTGTWAGCGNALGKDENYRAGNLSLILGTDGSFSLNDIEQDAIELAGTFRINSSSLSLQTDSENTWPEETKSLPAGWETLAQGGQIFFQQPDKQHLMLTYADISYFFEKQGTSELSENDTEDTNITVGPLLALAENDVWYSRDGSEAGDSTYKLALYDNYAELYVIHPETKNNETFMINFIYLTHVGDTFSFYTYKDKNMELPDIFHTLPEGYSKADISLYSSNESLTMEYNGQSLIFYNNVIYG